MRIDCLVGDVSVSIYESRRSSSVRIVSPAPKREAGYDFIFLNFAQFSEFLRKKLGYKDKNEKK